MAATAERFRFSAPEVALDPALSWVLARAFGPSTAEVAEPEGVAVAELAGRLGLASRIAARVSADRLAGELGDEAAAELRRLRTLAAAQEMRLRAALAAFDAVAAEMRVPYVPLKGLALALGGFASEGARASADIDLLVPESKLEALQAALVRGGFRETGQRYEHQAPALTHVEGGGSLELHRVLLGVRPGGKGSAGLDQLVERGLLGGSVPGFTTAWGGSGGRPRGDLRLPRRELLAAHALTHVLAQHALTPHLYPGLLLIGDLQDLGFHGSSGRAMLATIAPWIERAVSFREAEAALDLATALAKGGPDVAAESAARPAERADSRRLLDHFLAGTLVESYAESLKLRALEDPLSDRSKGVARAAAVAGALVPVRRKDGRGGRESLGAYLLRLAGRPLDLLRRYRSARAAAKR